MVLKNANDNTKYYFAIEFDNEVFEMVKKVGSKEINKLINKLLKKYFENNYHLFMAKWKK